MKKNNLKYIIGFALILAIIFVLFVVTKNHNKYKKPDYGYTAIIYHSEMEGNDAGIEYIYYIYKAKNNENEYFYIKTKSDITIAGSGKEKGIDSGDINSEKELERIKKDIEKDSNDNAQAVITYSYIENGINVECKDINELSDKLFK